MSTDTTTTATAEEQSTTNPEVETPRPEAVEYVDPHELTLAPNVRRDAELTEDFLSSVAANGVIETITAYRDDDGALTVLRGQRRTLAAQQTGQRFVPVRIIAKPAEVDRITDQATENLHRQKMKTSDLVLAVHELATLGESDTKIAKKWGVKREQVKAMRAASAAEDTLHAIDAGRLTFEEAGALAEFDDDPETQAELLSLPSWHRNRGIIEARRDREAQAAWPAHAEAMRQEGWTVLPYGTNPGHRGAGVLVAAAHVQADTGAPVEVTEETDCDALALALLADWTTEDDSDEETLTWREVVAVIDPARLGWISAEQWRAQHDGHLPSEAQAIEAAEAAKEADRAERREVITRNKEWKEATEARAAWFVTWAKGRKAPTGAERFIARAVCDTQLIHCLDGKGAPAAVAALTKTKKEDMAHCYGPVMTGLAQRAEKATPGAATMLTCAILVAAWEARVTREAWRNPSRTDALVMGALIQWGYEASEVERMLLGKS